MNAERISQSATPTYAESERDGWPAGPTRAPETDAAVAAASAAAAAAVAAVSAAIAATSASNAGRSNRRVARAAAEAAAAKAAGEAPVVASDVVAAPIVAAPIVAAPIVAAPIVAAPVVTSPVVTSPIVATPVAPDAAAGISAARIVAAPIAKPRVAKQAVPTTNYVRPPAPPNIPGITRAHHPEDDVPAAETFTLASPGVASPLPGEPPRRVVPTGGYFRPDPPPDVSGITRATDEEAAAAVVELPAVAPLFASEGFAHQKEVEPGWKVRIAAILAGILGALLAAGSALADKAGPPIHSARAALATRFGGGKGTAADATPASGGSTAGAAATHGFRDSRPFAWIASTVLAIRTGAVAVGTALAVVLLPIILGLGRIMTIPAHAINERLQPLIGQVGMPDFDADGNPRRKRRVAPFWLAFGGFYTVLALIIAMVWFGSAVGTSPSAGPSGSHNPGLIAAAGSPSQGASMTPTTGTSATSASPATPTPTPTPTKPPTPKPTKKPTPKPTKKPTPKPTPKPVIIKTSVASGQPMATYITVTVTTTTGASCTLSRTSATTTTRNYTATNPAAGLGTYQFLQVRDYQGNSPGTYTLTATCGTASAAISFIWK